MAIVINDNLDSQHGKALDDRSGIFDSGTWRPYNSVAEANASIPLAYRNRTLEVFITEDSKVKKFWYHLGTADANLKEYYPNVGPNFKIVNELADFPTPVAGVITLPANTSWRLTQTVDITPNRIVAGSNVFLGGISALNCTLTSSPGIGQTLITSVGSLNMDSMTLNVAGTGTKIFNLDAASSPGANCVFKELIITASTIGTIQNYQTFFCFSSIFSDIRGALQFDGTFGSVVFDSCIFASLISGVTSVDFPATFVSGLRVRFVFSGINTATGSTGINMNAGATIPTESYVLDNNNFSGSGTALGGVIHSDLRSAFSNNRGIINSITTGTFYMVNNVTATTIGVINTFVKAAGTTTSGLLNEKFTHSGTNRLTYTGSLTRRIKVTASASVSTTASNDLACALAKNGLVDATTAKSDTTGATGDFVSIYVQGVYEVINGDFFEVFVANLQAANNITVKDLSVIIETLE